MCCYNFSGTINRSYHLAIVCPCICAHVAQIDLTYCATNSVRASGVDAWTISTTVNVSANDGGVSHTNRLCLGILPSRTARRRIHSAFSGATPRTSTPYNVSRCTATDCMDWSEGVPGCCAAYASRSKSFSGEGASGGSPPFDSAAKISQHADDARAYRH